MRHGEEAGTRTGRHQPKRMGKRPCDIDGTRQPLPGPAPSARSSALPLRAPKRAWYRTYVPDSVPVALDLNAPRTPLR